MKPWQVYVLVWIASAAVPAAAAEGDPPKRVPWTTSQVHGSPEPARPYDVQRLDPAPTFKDPVDLCLAPESDRFYVAELAGRIVSFERGSAEPNLFFDGRTVVPGLEQLYGFTFPADFATNPVVYLCYAFKSDLPAGSRVSRFRVRTNGVPAVDPASEQILLTWLSGGHNGGCLKFGPDGYLYISTGDGAGPNPPDPLDTGQDVSDLLGAILRIDVRAPGAPYRVPADNPFISLPGARPEIWAYGFRNPWRMSFDAKTGALWVADVGWELWELVYRVERGGNYGWSIVEGRQSVRPNGRRGPTPILPPAYEHPHSEAASITGGIVYGGARWPDLRDAYVYGDWETGKIWALRHDGHRVTQNTEIADTRLRVISFAEDHQRELWVLDYNGGLYQLAVNPRAQAPVSFPAKLSQTGLFDSVRAEVPAPGVYPFFVAAPMWSDHASAERWIALPGAGSVNVATNPWRFPDNGVLVKTLSIEMQAGDPATRRRIETQLLHFDGESWHGYSYRWNETQDDAHLVPAAGEESTLEIVDARAPGGKRKQPWTCFSRAECLRCHNPWTGGPLGFRPEQLVGAREPETGRRVPDLFELELLSGKVRSGGARLVDPAAPSVSVESRARSYLHANCSHCHRENAGGSVRSLLNIEVDLRKAFLVAAPPAQGAFGIVEGAVIAPGDPSRSILLYRMAKTGAGRMPRLGSALVDASGVELMRQWIAAMNRATGFTLPPAGEPASIAGLRSNPVTLTESDRAVLLASTSGALALALELERCALPAAAKESIAREAMQRPAAIRDLFERFVPEDQRPKTLGSRFEARQVLALEGDVTSGRRLFQEEATLQCHRCHQAEGAGGAVGPDLSRIGAKYGPEELLAHIVEPSKSIAPEFDAYLVETQDDLAYTGVLIRRTPQEIVLRDSNGAETKLPMTQVTMIRKQELSLMPELLLSGLTAQQAADLIAYMSALR